MGSCVKTMGASCNSVGDFAKCLNAGAFIMKRSAWSLQFIKNVLARSAHADDSACSTQKFTGKWGFDQCFLNDVIGRGVGDQCAITCETMATDEGDTSDLEHFMCFGALSDKHFQHIQMAFSTPRPPKPFHPDTFVVNCFGGKRHGKDHAIPMQSLRNCVDFFASRVT